MLNDKCFLSLKSVNSIDACVRLYARQDRVKALGNKPGKLPLNEWVETLF